MPTVVRERVLHLLDDAMKRPLTVVSAPAGFGKTTALMQWLETVEARSAWISLDARDDDPRRLCMRLLHAFDGGAAPNACREPHRLVRSMAERAPDPLVIVLDDYHVLEQPACHQLVSELADELPATVRLLISTRTQPPLRLARRRASGAVAELGWRELRFDVDEAERLLNGELALGFDHTLIDAIVARVEGWPAGVALAPRGPDGIAEYVAEAVLAGTEPRLREFLRRTSILRRLTGPVCAAVLEDPAGHELLDEAHRCNLLVEDHEPGLRQYRPLAEALQHDLLATSPELASVLHRRAAAWFAANGRPEDAIHHAAADDGRHAAELLLRSWRGLLLDRRQTAMRRLLAELPADRGRLAGFCEALDALCAMLEDADPDIVADRLTGLDGSPEVAPVLDLMRVSHRFGDVGRAVADGWAAWERGSDMLGRAMLAGPFGVTLWFAGEHTATRDVVEPLVGVIGAAAGRTWALAALALTAAEEGDAEFAEHHARDAVEGADGDGVALGRHLAHLALAEALRLHGRFDEAADQLACATNLTGERPRSVDHAVTLVFGAQLAHSRHDHQRARARAAGARSIIHRYPDLGVLPSRLAGIEQGLQHAATDALHGSEPTVAERRVLGLLANDLTVEEIAAELYVSVHTVKSHRRRLYRRLGVQAREDALAVASERGLL